MIFIPAGEGGHNLLRLSSVGCPPFDENKFVVGFELLSLTVVGFLGELSLLLLPEEEPEGEGEGEKGRRRRIGWKEGLDGLVRVTGFQCIV